MGNPFIGGLNDPILEAAKGRLPGYEVWNKFGYNLDVDSGAQEVIASWGGTYSNLHTAYTLDIVSTSDEDKSGGTGAITLLIYGVDVNHLHITELVTLNGTTTVTTVNTYFGLNRIAVLSSGTSESKSY